MVEQIETFIALDFKYLFSGFFILLIVSKALWSSVEWLVVDKLGIETRAMRERREMSEKIDRLAEESERDRRTIQQEMEQYSEDRLKDREQSLKVDKELAASIEKLTAMFREKEIDDMRWEIINLADKISNGERVSKECFRHAISTHTKYQEIIEMYGMTNGEVDISMEIINDAYLKLLKEGS